MRLNEVEVGKKIEIILILDDKRLEFESVVQEILDDSILIEPITKDEKTVGFKNYEVIVIYPSEENKPYAWEGVEVKLVKYQEQIYHQLVAKSAGAPINRRNAYRQYVGVEGLVVSPSSRYKVVIKNVSTTGCAFVTEEELPLGENVMVSFSSEEENYTMRCVIVRRQDMEESGKIVYGCRMHTVNRKIEQFIMKCQRKDMQRRNS